MKSRRTRWVLAVCALGIVAVLGFLGMRYVEERRWIGELESEDWSVVEEAMDRLVARRSTNAIPALLDGAVRAYESDRDTGLERYLAFREALAKVVDRKSAQLLIDRLDSNRVGGRRIAMHVLGDIAWRIERFGGASVLQSALDKILVIYDDGDAPNADAILEAVPRFGQVALKFARDRMARMAESAEKGLRMPDGPRTSLVSEVLASIAPYAKSCRPHVFALLRAGRGSSSLADCTGVDFGRWIRGELSALVQTTEGFTSLSAMSSPERAAFEKGYERVLRMLESRRPHLLTRNAERPIAPFVGDRSVGVVLRYLDFAEDKVSAVRDALSRKVERRGVFVYLQSHLDLVPSVEEELLSYWLGRDERVGFSGAEAVVAAIGEDVRQHEFLRFLDSGKSVHYARALQLLATIESSETSCFDRLAERFQQAAVLDQVGREHIVLVSELGQRGLPFVSGIETIIARTSDHYVKFSGRCAISIIEERPIEENFFALALKRHDLDAGYPQILRTFFKSSGPYIGTVVERLREGSGVPLEFDDLIRSCGDRALDALIKVAESDERKPHGRAFSILQGLRLSWDSVPRLSVLLRHSDLELREFAARRLAGFSELDRGRVLSSIDQEALESFFREGLLSDLPLRWSPLCSMLRKFGDWGLRLEDEVLRLARQSFKKHITLGTLVNLDAKRSVIQVFREDPNSGRKILRHLSHRPDLSEELVGLVRDMLASPEWETRSEAAFCLLSHGIDPHAEASQVIADRLLRPLSNRIRLKLLHGLRDCRAGYHLTPFLIEWLRQRREPDQVAEVLISWGPNSMDAVLSALDGADPLMQSWLLSILGQIGNEAHGAISKIETFMNHETPELRACAVEALGRIRRISPETHLRMERIRDKDAFAFVREQAREALDLLSSPDYANSGEFDEVTAGIEPFRQRHERTTISNARDR